MKSAFVLLFFLAVAFQQSVAQCDITADVCEGHINASYISDGQQYRALLLEDQVAEFNVTLFGGTTYRFAACSGTSDGNLVFRVYDKKRNLLFTNLHHNNAPYWDFQITNSMETIIEAELDAKAGGSGCAVLLIGFKR